MIPDRRPPGNAGRAGLDWASAGEYDTPGLSRPDSKTGTLDRHVWVFPLLAEEPATLTAPTPGDVRENDPGLTPRVREALTIARLTCRPSHPITDDDGPHEHHWQAVLWWCRGCGAFDEE